MSAAELRKAADAERADWGGKQNAHTYPVSSAIHLALADLLDSVADISDLPISLPMVSDTDVDAVAFASVMSNAKTVARLINGGAA